MHRSVARLQHLERNRQSGGARAGLLVTRVRCFTVVKVDSIGLVLRRCFQCRWEVEVCQKPETPVTSDFTALDTALDPTASGV